MSGVDAYAPAEIASLVRTRGVAKANTDALSAFVLGVVAGAFIALGAVFATLVGTDSTFGFGITRWLAGIAFSLGLILVVIAGAELFTGNNLMVMAVATRQVTVTRLLRMWAIVYVGNFVGALSVVAMVSLAGWWTLDDKAVGTSAVAIAAQKTALPFGTIFFRGSWRTRWCAWRCGSRPARVPSRTRCSPSCRRSRRSWRTASNTRSRTCTSSRWGSC
jgi:formate transporter